MSIECNQNCTEWLPLGAWQRNTESNQVLCEMNMRGGGGTGGGGRGGSGGQGGSGGGGGGGGQGGSGSGGGSKDTNPCESGGDLGESDEELGGDDSTTDW